MDNHDITMKEYVQLETERALRNDKVYNWKTTTYGNIWYDDDAHYLRVVETKFPAIVYNDALASKSEFSSKLTSYEHKDIYMFAVISIGADIHAYAGISSWTENMELIDEENMPNDLLALSVYELDEKEYVDQLLSIVSSLEDDPSSKDLNFFQSQLYLQQTPEEVIDVSDSQDLDLAIDDGHFYTNISNEGSKRNQEFGSLSLAPDYLRWIAFSQGDVTFNTNTDSDSNFMNSDDNYVASVDVFIVQEQSYFVPENVDLEMDFSDHNNQTDFTSDIVEVRKFDCIETLQPKRLPLTRKVLIVRGDRIRISKNLLDKVSQLHKPFSSPERLKPNNTVIVNRCLFVTGEGGRVFVGGSGSGGVEQEVGK
nr:hypothetical protein [Tanacetum cinerariifolium]